MVIDMNEKICGENCSFLRHTTINGQHYYKCINHCSTTIEGLKETCMYEMITKQKSENMNKRLGKPIKQFVNDFIDAQEQLNKMNRKLETILKMEFPTIDEIDIRPMTVYCYECGELDDMFEENGMRITAYTDNPKELIQDIEKMADMSCIECKGYGRFNSEGKAEQIEYTMDFIMNYDD